MPAMAAEIGELDRAFRRCGVREAGVVYHFSKTRGRDAEQGRPQAWGRNSHDDPGSKANPSGYRFAGYYVSQRCQAMALADLLLTFPRMLERVRGIDICTDELGVPLWVMLPLLRHVARPV